MSSDNRGLVSADEKAKERVSKADGEAVSRDGDHMSEICKKGGQK